MTAEITKITAIGELRGWLLYDADCPFCSGWAARLEKVLTRRRFDLAPLQSPWVQECLGVNLAQPFTEMRVLTPHGLNLGGADAVVYLARRIWWAWPLYALSRAPGMTRLLRISYRGLAQRRHCLSRNYAAGEDPNEPQRREARREHGSW